MKTVLNAASVAVGALFLGACATQPPVTVIQRVPQYIAIPSALLQACPGADWTKVHTWRDVALAAKVEQAARAKCQAEINAIRALGLGSPNKAPNQAQ